MQGAEYVECDIWGSHSGAYEDYFVLDCDGV